MTVRKTDDERLQELEEKMAQIKAKKQQLASRIQSKERKERTRRLIQVGAIFEKYFDIIGEDQAEKIAYGMKTVVEKNKEKLLNIDVAKARSKNENVGVVYDVPEEKLIVPEGNKTPYQTASTEVKETPKGEGDVKRLAGYQLKHVKSSNE